MKKVVILGLAVAVAGCGAGQQEQEPEAIYAGEPASYWADGLSDPDPEVRRITAVALGVLGDEAAPLAGFVVDRLADDAPEVRAAAREALVGMGTRILPDLERALDAEDSLVRAQAAQALGAFGSAAGPAVSALGRAIASDPAWEVRYRAAEALGEIGSAARGAEAQLRAAAADDEDANVRAAATAALARIAP